MSSANELIAVARSQIGVTESPHGSNCQKYSHELGRPCQSWCADFAAWCAKQIDLWLPSTSSYTPSMADGFRHAGRWHTSGPEAGDFGFIDFPGDSKRRIQHVVIVSSSNGRSVATIEGNTSSGMKGSQDNGGGVFPHKRDMSLFVGFGRPNFSSSSPPAKASAPSAALHEEDEMFLVIGYAGGPALWAFFPALGKKVTFPGEAAYKQAIAGAGFGGHLELGADDVHAIPYLDPKKADK